MNTNSFERVENGNKKKQANDKSRHRKIQHLKLGEHINILQKNCESLILFPPSPIKIFRPKIVFNNKQVAIKHVHGCSYECVQHFQSF